MVLRKFDEKKNILNLTKKYQEFDFALFPNIGRRLGSYPENPHNGFLKIKLTALNLSYCNPPPMLQERVIKITVILAMRIPIHQNEVLLH